MSVVQEIVSYAKSIARGDESVRPGQPVNFTEASTVNDRAWQGDMAVTIDMENPPLGFVKKDKVTVQLVPGNTVGSKHCLEHTTGVEQWVPESWNEEGLVGPWMKFNEANRIIHPVHGPIGIPAGFCVQITYQREGDLILKAERRARD